MKLISPTLKYFFLVMIAVIAIFPFIWLVSTSLKGAEEIFAFPPTLIPDKINLENYSGVCNTIPFGTYFINSIIVVVASVLINLLLASLTGFALARFNFKGKSFFFFLVLASMLIPKEIVIIPLYRTVLSLGLLDTLAGVVLPFAVEGFAIFMMRQAFLAIPKEIEEAAIVDGANLFTIWWKVLLPITKPTLATLAIFTFIGTWGDFIWPLVVLKSSENFTLQVGLSYMLGTFVNNYRYVAAGSVLAVIPVIILFFAMQKYFIKGIVAGSGK
jgi:putative chitobiose transport system permease protein